MTPAEELEARQVAWTVGEILGEALMSWSSRAGESKAVDVGIYLALRVFADAMRRGLDRLEGPELERILVFAREFGESAVLKLAEKSPTVQA